MHAITAHLLKNPLAFIIPICLFIVIVLGGFILRRILFGVVRKWAASTDSHLLMFSSPKPCVAPSSFFPSSWVSMQPR